MSNQDPYKGKIVSKWPAITEALVKKHPLETKTIVDVVFKSWDQIFSSKIGDVIKIGEEIALTPQMIGNFLHILIAHNLAIEFPGLWRKESATDEKDLVYIPNNLYSFEVKSSSSKNDIYGNRSYGQITANGKKSKDGYYLSVNFTKPTKGGDNHVTKIKFGWLDHSDWVAQASATGQQSHLTLEAKKFKLATLYSK